MPTRIVLQESTPPSRVHATHGAGLSDEEEYAIRVAAMNGGESDDEGGPFSTPPRPRLGATPPRMSSSHRKVVGFRSSILRELSQPTDDDDTMINSSQDEAAKQRRLQLHLSNEDIRASPRLLGYLFGSIGTT